MTLYENLWDRLIVNIDKHNPFAFFVASILSRIDVIRFRVFVRGKCAIFGCQEKTSGYGAGGYLPDDCYEWWCERCWAEGINSTVHTRELFYKDTPIKNLIRALKGN